jgi:phosphoribosylanthranilate isomerase
MLIKASRINNLTDARYFAAKDVHFLGFNLEEGTAGFMEPGVMKAIIEWVEGPQIIGEFSKSSPNYILEALNFFGLHGIQAEVRFNGRANEITQNSGSATCFLRYPVGKQDALTLVEQFYGEVPAGTDYVVLDFSESDLTYTDLLEDDFWSNNIKRFPTFLQLDAPAAAFPLLRDKLNPVGFNFSGGEEERVGLKSFEDLDAVFDALFG